MHTVTTIDLSSNNLHGTIPSSLGSLSSLTGVTLAANNLTGTIPSQLGSLANLHVLIFLKIVYKELFLQR